MHADLKYVESIEKEINELESNKEEFSNMYDILLQECVFNDVMCSYLHSLSDLDAHTELQCLYLHKVKECECLAQKLSKQSESVSKEVYTKLLRSCAKLEKHSISIELALQQCQEQMKNDIVCKEKTSNVFLKEREQYFEIQDLKAQLNTNPRMCTSTGVTHRTNVSRPQLRSTQMKDKVVPNTSQVKFKKTEVEDHHRISSISNKTKSVTMCNDNLKSRTSNVNAVCATCGKCVFNSNHDACVFKFLNDVNARTKKPKVVPISTRKPKSQANKSVATPTKKTVASDFTIIKSKSYYRMLYEKTSKAWKWWIEQQFPLGYKWVPKTKMKWVPKVRKENVEKRVIFAIDNASRITNILKLTNTLGSNLSSMPSSSNSLADCSTHPIHFQGNITINKAYYVEGLNHNLFSVGNDLLTGNRGSNHYTISLQETTSSTLICLMAKASATQTWLWHRRLSHLNFDYINLLSKKDVVIGLPKMKYVKDQLCSSCEVSKAKRSSFKTKTVPSLKGQSNTPDILLDTLLRTKDEQTETLNALVKIKELSIKLLLLEHKSNQTRCQKDEILHSGCRLATMMLSASKLPLFFWAEAIATACYTQNRSIIIPSHEKMAYHIINDRKPLIKHLHIFGFTCYLTKDGENLDKMKEKGDPCILVGHSTQSMGYRVYNKRTRLIVESIHLRFDEIKEMSEISYNSFVTTASSQQELDLLFGPLYDEFFKMGTSSVNKSSSPTNNSAQQDTQSTTNIQSLSEPSTPTNVNVEENTDNQAEDAQFQQKIAESSSRNIDNSNMHSFNQP
ncbi:retrovirus-related pol polyprotein from transposon TNT 1-94 [Tanacetum coccineum]